jgi:hypothetical protein
LKPSQPLLRIYRVFGAILASDFPFRVLLPPGECAPDLTFTAVSSRPVLATWEDQEPLYTSPWSRTDGESVCRLFRSGDSEILSFPKVADFYLWPGRIVCHVLAPELRHLVELHLLGPVFSYWLERRERIVLHSSAVALGGRVAAFVGRHGDGKSGLAAALLRSGGALLSDDVVPLEMRSEEILAHPSFPQMRMWPDEAACFLDRFEHLPLVHPDLTKRWVPVGPGGLGLFQANAAPLSSIYLLDRRPEADEPLEIRTLSPRDAVIELLRHSFTPLLVEAAGLQPARLDFLARLALQVPVKRLRYPSGFDRLPAVAEAVRLDLDKS